LTLTVVPVYRWLKGFPAKVCKEEKKRFVSPKFEMK